MQEEPKHKSGDWLSWLERLVDIEEVTDSNSVSPTSKSFQDNTLRAVVEWSTTAFFVGPLRGPLNCNLQCNLSGPSESTIG